jgi:hypothetical protein
MSASSSSPSIGFLTVLDQQEAGLFGGYLVLNACGRPLEFHCTAPVKANRAQQILYARTLAPYLYGEQIGQALLAKAKVEPLWICTDVEPALAVRDFTPAPVACLLPPEERASPSGDVDGRLRLDAPYAAAQSTVSASQSTVSTSQSAVPAPHAVRLLPFELGGHRLAVPPSREADRAAVVARWSDYAELDLLEPFARIREAIEEAQKAAR